MMLRGFMYIISNKNHTVLYVGASTKLVERIEAHINGKATEFTKKYNVNELMYFEVYKDSHDAFMREKQVKNWRKEWKWNLIRTKNPELKNLYLEIRHLDNGMLK